MFGLDEIEPPLRLVAVRRHAHSGYAFDRYPSAKCVRGVLGKLRENGSGSRTRNKASEKSEPANAPVV